MSNTIPGNNKHLTLADRRYIEEQLNLGTSFKDIARFLCKDPTTISKEVKLHRYSNFYKPPHEKKTANLASQKNKPY